MSTRQASTDAPLLIVGAGPTGLGAAYRLAQLAHGDFMVLDGADRVGGLATSYVDRQGFTWDIGGHVQFSHYSYFDRLMGEALGDRWLHHEREAWVWIGGHFVPYPLQNNIHCLGKGAYWKCLQGLVELYRHPRVNRPGHFGEWIEATFGKGLGDVFMVPYNFKVWAHPAEQMDYGWVGERVAPVDLERVLHNALVGRVEASWGPNNTFQFPLQGGTGAIWEAVADLVGREHISLNTEVMGIDVEGRTLFLADGTSLAYEALISTMPLDRLVAMAGIPGLRERAAALTHSTTHVIGIGLSGTPPETLKTKCWMYFPEDSTPCYRVTVFSNYSPNNVPTTMPCWSLMAEVSESRYKPVDKDSLVDDTISALRNAGVIEDRHDVISTWYYCAPYGYPVPTLGRDHALETIHAELERRGIYSRGRFGGWKYEVSNQDHSVMQGVEVVNRLLLGVPEVTYWFPNTANDLRYGKRG